MRTVRRTVELAAPKDMARMTHKELQTFVIAALWKRQAELGAVHDLLSLTIDYVRATLVARYEATVD